MALNRLNMHIRLVAACVLLIAATTGAVGFLGVKTIHHFVQTRFEDRMWFLARSVALSAELGVLIDQKKMLRELAEKLLAEKDVIGVQIVNNNNETLGSSSKAFSGDSASVETPVLLKEEQEGSLAFQSGDPVVEKEKIIGKVKVIYSTAEMMHLRNTLTNRFVMTSVIFSLVGIVLFFFISRTIVAQITRVVTAARRVSEGDIKARPEPGNLPETRELTLAFNAMLDSIEWSNKALEDAYQEMLQQKTLAELGKFSMMIAHEFKNPLSIIKGSLTNLKKELSTPFADNTMIRYMDEEIQHLNRLIEDFLLFSKPVKPVFRSIDLNATVSACLMRHQDQAEAVSITIEDRVPVESCMANADGDLIIRVMDNLVKNALDSSHSGTSIRVSASADGRVWRLHIEDQGEGIPEENLDKIFEPFFTTRAKGTGLGLAFVKQVVTAHNGKIRAENIESRGACFTVDLPIFEKQPAA
jgi:signal transduction histidine kinase